ncbi:uncharacterized protein LOC143205881 [Rhynchophorus ferrugineus]|uniref:uncharacterized protein LOC143205881 n=1 Tax=Rhynchophorus ferrugineus TaxID=354439 RepID=UPI003FCE32D5
MIKRYQIRILLLLGYFRVDWATQEYSYVVYVMKMRTCSAIAQTKANHQHLSIFSMPFYMIEAYSPMLVVPNEPIEIIATELSGERYPNNVLNYTVNKRTATIHQIQDFNK